MQRVMVHCTALHSLRGMRVEHEHVASLLRFAHHIPHVERARGRALALLGSFRLLLRHEQRHING